jgi:hypothetical protein
LKPARLLRIAALLALAGCRGKLDVPCVLEVANPDGGDPVALRERQLVGTGWRARIFLSSTGRCELGFCVRDSFVQVDAGPDEPATGYCSAACSSGPFSVCNDGLSCQSLLLDEQTLADGGFGPFAGSSYCFRTAAASSP